MKLSISKKFCKRSIKCLAMFAPLAYLFGSLFFGLNGAHGEQLWAQPVYSQEYVSVDGFGEVDSTYRMVVDDNNISDYATFLYDSFSVSVDSYRHYITSDISVNGLSFLGYWYQFESSRVRFGFYVSGLSTEYISVGSDYSYTLYLNLSWDVISSDSRSWGCFDVDYLTVLFEVPTSYVPENNSAFTDFTFKQFFAKDNFLQQWGENAISDNPKGFAPFGTFIKYIDDNMLHLSDSQIGLMAYGYLYYTLHVLIAFFAFDILGFIPLFLQRVTDKIGGTEDD